MRLDAIIVVEFPARAEVLDAASAEWRVVGYNFAAGRGAGLDGWRCGRASGEAVRGYCFGRCDLRGVAWDCVGG